MNCRILQSGKCTITQGCTKGHVANDLVKEGRQLDYIVAHSEGTVCAVVSNCNTNTSKTGQKIYGNYVKIRHDNGMYTLYAHMKYGSVAVSNGQRVSKGQVLGYMGNTGYSFGGHLHFEVRNTSNVCIDPSAYINADLPSNRPTGTFNVRVDKACGAYVRTQPNTTSALGGSKLLKKGDVFKATEIVDGQSVNGNNKWYHSKVGNYVWSGGCTKI